MLKVSFNMKSGEGGSVHKKAVYATSAEVKPHGIVYEEKGFPFSKVLLFTDLIDFKIECKVTAEMTHTSRFWEKEMKSKSSGAPSIYTN